MVRTFTLLVGRKAPLPPARIDFDADDPARAFTIAQRHGENFPVEVWEGKKRLGKLTLVRGGLWQID